MGTILSKEKNIEAVMFERLRKGRVMKAKAIVQLNDDIAIVQLANGTYSVVGRGGSINGPIAVLSFGSSHWSNAVLDGMVRIGAVTADEVNRHKKAVKEHAEQQERKYAIKRLEEACETLGIAVPEYRA